MIPDRNLCSDYGKMDKLCKELYISIVKTRPMGFLNALFSLARPTCCCHIASPVFMGQLKNEKL